MSKNNVWLGVPPDNVQQIAEVLDIRDQGSLAQVDRSFSALVTGVKSYASLVGCTSEHFQNTGCEAITKTLNCNDVDAFQSALIEMCQHPPSKLVIISSRKLPRDLGWEGMVLEASLRHVLRCTVAIEHVGGNPSFLCHLIRGSYLRRLKYLSLAPYQGRQEEEGPSEMLQEEDVDAKERASIGAAGMEAITGAISKGSLPSLLHLDLRSCKIGDSGVIYLAGLVSSDSLSKLEVLWLADNQITDVSPIVNSGKLRKLNHLDLNKNQVDLAGLSKAISKRLLPALRTLEVEVEGETPITAACEANGIEII